MKPFDTLTLGAAPSGLKSFEMLPRTGVSNVPQALKPFEMMTSSPPGMAVIQRSSKPYEMIPAEGVATKGATVGGCGCGGKCGPCGGAVSDTTEWGEPKRIGMGVPRANYRSQGGVFGKNMRGGAPGLTESPQVVRNLLSEIAGISGINTTPGRAFGAQDSTHDLIETASYVVRQYEKTLTPHVRVAALDLLDVASANAGESIWDAISHGISYGGPRCDSTALASHLVWEFIRRGANGNPTLLGFIEWYINCEINGMDPCVPLMNASSNCSPPSTCPGLAAAYAACIKNWGQRVHDGPPTADEIRACRAQVRQHAHSTLGEEGDALFDLMDSASALDDALSLCLDGDPGSGTPAGQTEEHGSCVSTAIVAGAVVGLFTMVLLGIWGSRDAVRIGYFAAARAIASGVRRCG